MRTKEELAEVKALSLAGLNHCQISRKTGIPRSTVREWLTGRQPVRLRLRLRSQSCELCGHSAHNYAQLPQPEYAYLLGLYLGDGCISDHPRGVYRMRVVLDMRYPGIIMECAAAMRAVMPFNAVHVQHNVGGENAAEVSCYSKAWRCLFPQYGRGRKHRRPIVLAEWQKEIAETHTGWLLRGLIHSDGCRTINRSMGKEYVRYFFDQHSNDIREIFCWACDLLGIAWRQSRWKTISIARRESVAVLDELVGPKS